MVRSCGGWLLAGDELTGFFDGDGQGVKESLKGSLSQAPSAPVRPDFGSRQSWRPKSRGAVLMSTGEGRQRPSMLAPQECGDGGQRLRQGGSRQRQPGSEPGSPAPNRGLDPILAGLQRQPERTSSALAALTIGAKPASIPSVWASPCGEPAAQASKMSRTKRP